jgi:hypothetical protein
MSGKLDGLSGKQARDRVQSDCKVLGSRRSPFADITNKLDSRLSSPPPLQSHTLNRVAVQNENDPKISGSGEPRSCHPAEPTRNRRAARPSATSLNDTRSSLPVKPVSVVPSVPPLDSVPHLRGDSLWPRPRRQVSLGSGVLNQSPHDPGLCGDSAVNDVLLCDAPDARPPLSPYPGPSTREPLSTSLLPPKTHKLACGQLAILPSRSVLVDFREGERRKGRKGEEVMVVSPNGDQVNCLLRIQGTWLRNIKIHLFSAPHLSTPCCLAEPIVTYSLSKLPVDQYKLYEQAKKVIEHIKRNVTKVRLAGSMNEVRCKPGFA